MNPERSNLAVYRKYFILLILVFAQIIFGIGGGIIASGIYHKKSDLVLPGIEVSGIDLQGLTRWEARDKLENSLSLPPALILVWEDESFEIPLDPSVSRYLIDELLEGTEDVREFSGDREFIFNLISWSPRRQSLTPRLTASPDYLWHELDNIKALIDREAQDAEIYLDMGVPVVLPEKWGLSLDIDASRKVILEFLAKGDTKDIPLQVTYVAPDITSSRLPDFSHVLALAITSLEDSEPDRIHNIALATGMLSEIYLEPGEVFSFNEKLGRATAEKGFREVPVIINREFVPGIGGGICQVSTTIYLAALKAELDVVQRTPHSRPVSYVPLGQDATVSHDLLDLKIRNNRDFPLLLVGKVNEMLEFSVYGKREYENREVEISSEDITVISPQTLEQPDPNLPMHTRQVVREGQDGYQVNVHRIIYENGRLISKDIISTDFYPPVHEVVRIGKKQIAGEK